MVSWESMSSNYYFQFGSISLNKDLFLRNYDRLCFFRKGLISKKRISRKFFHFGLDLIFALRVSMERGKILYLYRSIRLKTFVLDIWFRNLICHTIQKFFFKMIPPETQIFSNYLTTKLNPLMEDSIPNELSQKTLHSPISVGKLNVRNCSDGFFRIELLPCLYSYNSGKTK